MLGIPGDEIDYLCAGINHMAFYLKFERNGEDLYPELSELAAEDKYPAWERVRARNAPRVRLLRDRIERALHRVRALVHQAGPADLIEQYNIPLDEYPARCEDQIADWGEMRAALLSDDPSAMDQYKARRRRRSTACGSAACRRWRSTSRRRPKPGARRSWPSEGASGDGHSGEYGTLIIHSMETGQPRVIYGNVSNTA